MLTKIMNKKEEKQFNNLQVNILCNKMKKITITIKATEIIMKKNNITMKMMKMVLKSNSMQKWKD